MVELAVSMAIVGTLVVALLPALTRARTEARVMSCLSNQHVLGVGWASYTENYQQIPGLNYQEGLYWAQDWGRPYLYGGVQAWMADAPVQPIPPYQFGLWGGEGTHSVYSGIGYVFPFVGGDGTDFYCPGTVASFDHSPIPDDPSVPWGMEGYTFGQGWYSTWTGIDPPFGNYKFGEQGTGTLLTYYYRSGMYEVDTNLPDTSPGWGGGYGSGTNWKRDTISHPDEPHVQGKPMLTCYWVGGWYSGWTPADGARYDAIPHDGTETNLLWTDGSAGGWTLPSQVTQVNSDGSTTLINKTVTAPWGWFDAGAYRMSEYDSSNFYTQMPFFWVMAKRDAR